MWTVLIFQQYAITKLRKKRVLKNADANIRSFRSYLEEMSSGYFKHVAASWGKASFDGLSERYRNVERSFREL